MPLSTYVCIFHVNLEPNDSLQDSCQAMLVSQNGHDSESTQRAPTEPEAMALVRKNTSLTKIGTLK